MLQCKIALAILLTALIVVIATITVKCNYYLVPTAFALVGYLPTGGISLDCDETICHRFPISLVPLRKHSASCSVPS